MKFTKKAVAAAVTTALGSAGAVQAADILNMTIQDISGDGVAGGFAFAAPGSTAYTNFFDSTSSVTFTPTFGAPISISPTNTMGITADGSDEGTTAFTAGFLFSGAPFLPTSLNATGTGTGTNPGLGGIDGSVNTGDSALTMSEFNWSGQFGTNLFPLSPTGGAFTLNSATQGAAACAVGSTDVCYTLQWESLIAPQGGFSGDTIWQLEGVAKLDTAVDLGGVPPIPVPAAVWLFGSGLLGLVGVARRKKKA